ncbi:hypothetical protein ACLOJK_012233 [Asimina triloba]
MDGQDDGGGFESAIMSILLPDQYRCHCRVDSSSPKSTGDAAIAESEGGLPPAPTVTVVNGFL